jgi:hypothetical protein
LQFFNNKKFVPNLAFPVIEAALFQESWPLIIDLLTFLLHFMLDPGPECITVTVSVPLRLKFAVQVPAPVQHHWDPNSQH